MPKILIVDDHPITRDGLATRLSLEKDLEVCGEACDVNDALEVIQSHAPDLAVVDISLESGNGIDLVKEIKYRFPKVRILVWSMYDESLYADRALRAGADGYINKKHAREAIVSAIRTVLAGNVYLCPEHSARLLRQLSQGRQALAADPVESLSDRELEAFSLIGHGMKTREIAKRMCLSPNTVETYRSRIKEKLGLKHTAELARVATQWVLENT